MPMKKMCLGAIAALVVVKGLGASEALTKRLIHRVAVIVGPSVDSSSSGVDGGSMIGPAISTNDEPPRSLEEFLGRLNSWDLGRVYGSDGAIPRIEQADAENAFTRAKLFSIGIPFADSAL